MRRSQIAETSRSFKMPLRLDGAQNETVLGSAMPFERDDVALHAQLEFWSMKFGPDGLVRVTRRPSGRGINGSWVVSANEAEPFVLAEWANFHRSWLGFPPSWSTATTAALSDRRAS
jgi:hypothetical protein